MGVPTIHIPGYGEALAGLDWLALPGLDGKRTEIRQLGRGSNAAWQYVWSSRSDNYVAFASKADSKKRPMAAPALVKQAIDDPSYLVVIDVGDVGLWSFGVVDYMPAGKIDQVGDRAEIMAGVRDFLSMLPDAAQAPIYTDKPELFEALPFTLDVRPFSLDILSHSLKKRAASKAAFSGYSSVPMGMIAIGLTAVLGVGGFFGYQQMTVDQTRRDAAVSAQRDATQKAQQLAQQIAQAINAAPPVSVAISAYLQSLSALPLHVAGWRLSGAECAGSACTLTFDAQPFATWGGYMRDKPAAWPAPILGTNIQKVEQVIPVKIPAFPVRSVGSLPYRQDLVLTLGNLAQLAKPIDVTLALANRGEPVAVSPNATYGVDPSVPVKAGFTVSGSAALLQDVAARLPEAAGVVDLSIKLTNEKTTFDLKGEAYANP